MTRTPADDVLDRNWAAWLAARRTREAWARRRRIAIGLPAAMVAVAAWAGWLWLRG